MDIFIGELNNEFGEGKYTLADDNSTITINNREYNVQEYTGQIKLEGYYKMWVNFPAGLDMGAWTKSVGGWLAQQLVYIEPLGFDNSTNMDTYKMLNVFDDYEENIYVDTENKVIRGIRVIQGGELYDILPEGENVIGKADLRCWNGY